MPRDYYPKQNFWEWLADFWPNIVVVALISCIPLGIVMAFWTDDPDWLWFCLVLLIFLS